MRTRVKVDFTNEASESSASPKTRVSALNSDPLRVRKRSSRVVPEQHEPEVAQRDVVEFVLAGRQGVGDVQQVDALKTVPQEPGPLGTPTPVGA